MMRPIIAMNTGHQRPGTDGCRGHGCCRKLGRRRRRSSVVIWGKKQTMRLTVTRLETVPNIVENNFTLPDAMIHHHQLKELNTNWCIHGRHSILEMNR